MARSSWSSSGLCLKWRQPERTFLHRVAVRDAVDGLGAGLGALISFLVGVVSFQNAQPLLGWICIGMMGACLGFLPFNFRLRREAAIFLGDTGSTFIGFTLAYIAIDGGDCTAVGSAGADLASIAGVGFWLLQQ